MIMIFARNGFSKVGNGETTQKYSVRK